MKLKNRLFQLVILMVLLFNLSGCTAIVVGAGIFGAGYLYKEPATVELPYLYENCMMIDVTEEDNTYQLWISDLTDRNNFYDLFYIAPKDNDYLDRLIIHHVDKAVRKQFKVISKTPIDAAPIFEKGLTKILDPYKYRGSWYKVKKK